MKLKRLILAFAFIYAPIAASAWGVLGHRIVGEIADSYLSPNARKAVKQILGNETLAMSANWADFIKSDTTYKYLSPWHYVNLPVGLDRKGLDGYLDNFTEPNIYNKANEMIALLKDPKTPAEKKVFAMRILVHLIGDMHQPMHTARKEDLGGNRISVTWFGQKSNLHRVWDEQLIDFQQLSYTEYTKAINFATPEQLATWNKASIKDCIFESYQVCNQIYATGIKNDDKLSYNYNFDWIATLNQQLLKGGVRLAKILNEIYK
jgi:S1/P1 Nuclease